MKLMFHWNKINYKQEKENSSRAWKEAFAYEIILSTKSQSQGDQVITKYQDKTERTLKDMTVKDYPKCWTHQWLEETHLYQPSRNQWWIGKMWCHPHLAWKYITWQVFPVWRHYIRRLKVRWKYQLDILSQDYIIWEPKKPLQWLTACS